MLYLLAILGAVVSWEASKFASQYGLPENVAEIAPFLAVVSACLWAVCYLERGASRRQLWLAIAPFAWIVGGVVGANLDVPDHEPILWWLPSGWQSPAMTTAIAGYLMCLGLLIWRPGSLRTVEEKHGSGEVESANATPADAPTLH